MLGHMVTYVLYFMNATMGLRILRAVKTALVRPMRSILRCSQVACQALNWSQVFLEERLDEVTGSSIGGTGRTSDFARSGLGDTKSKARNAKRDDA